MKNCISLFVTFKLYCYKRDGRMTKKQSLDLDPTKISRRGLLLPCLRSVMLSSRCAGWHIVTNFGKKKMLILKQSPDLEDHVKGGVCVWGGGHTEV